MTDRIIGILKRLGIETWRVSETRSETAELYFIRRALDIPRVKRLQEWTVEVFGGEKQPLAFKDGKAVIPPFGGACVLARQL